MNDQPWTSNRGAGSKSLSSNYAPQRPRMPACNRSLSLRWNADYHRANSQRHLHVGEPTCSPFSNVISESSRRLLGGQTALVTRVAGGMLHLAACTAGSRASHEEIRASFPAPLASSGIHSRAAMNSTMVFRSDIETEPGIPQAVKRWPAPGGTEASSWCPCFARASLLARSVFRVPNRAPSPTARSNS